MWLNKIVRIVAVTFWVMSLNGCYTMIQRDSLSVVEDESAVEDKPSIEYVPVYLPPPIIIVEPAPVTPPVPVSPQPQAPLIKYRNPDPESNSSDRQGSSGRLRDNGGSRSGNDRDSQNIDGSRSRRR